MPERSPKLPLRVLEHVLRAPTAGASEPFLDPVTSLPTLQLLVQRIQEMLASRKGVGILTLSIAQFAKLEDIYGWETFDHIVRGVAACLKSVKDDALRKEDALAELTVNGNIFVLLLSPPRHNRQISYRDLARLKQRVTKKLDAYLAQALAAELLHRFGYFIGCAILRKDPSVRLERLLYRAIDEALADATAEEERAHHKRLRDLRDILTRRRIGTVYQPIVDLRSARVVGYEALSRGPRGELQAPDLLFRIARETELIWKLDRVCRERALRGFKRLQDGQLMFLNMEPLSIFDPYLTQSVSHEDVASRVVFEVTEHAAIADFATFRQAVQLLKRAGFKVAVDDVGAAYSGLRAIAEIEPDYIKLDMALTRGSDRNEVKLHLMRAVAKFCEDTGIALIVEGVEAAEELEAVRSVGVPFAQGFVFGQPVSLPGKERAPSLGGTP